MSSSVYAVAAIDILDPTQLGLDLTSATNKATLFLTALVPNFLTNSDFTAAPYTSNEVSGGGYTPGGQVLTTQTFVAAGAAPVCTYNADDPAWTNITATGMRWSIFYADGLAGNNVYYGLDFGADFNASAGPVTIVFDVLGIFTWTL